MKMLLLIVMLAGITTGFSSLVYAESVQSVNLSASLSASQVTGGHVIETVLDTVRKIVGNDLRRAARKAGVRIKTRDMVIASRDDLTIALAQALDNECDMFGYFKLPPKSGLAEGIYEITIDPAPNFQGVGRATFRDLSGQIVLADQPVTHERIPGGPTMDGLSLDIEADQVSAGRWKPQGDPGLHIIDVLTIRF